MRGVLIVEIKVDCKMLNEQIELCDAYADMLKIAPLKGMFYGIAEFLSAICYAIENDREIHFVKCEEN